MSTSPVSPRTVTLPSARVLVGVVYATCVLGSLAVFGAVIVFTDQDPYAPQGPVASMIGIGTLGTAALLVVVGTGLWQRGAVERARTASVILGALSVVTLVAFWSGAPGVLGAGAAGLAGLTRGGRALGGAARVAGLVGAFIAVLNVVLVVGGIILGGLT